MSSVLVGVAGIAVVAVELLWIGGLVWLAISIF
jgi:hypothetical protein